AAPRGVDHQVEGLPSFGRSLRDLLATLLAGRPEADPRHPPGHRVDPEARGGDAVADLDVRERREPAPHHPLEQGAALEVVDLAAVEAHPPGAVVEPAEVGAEV